MRVQDMTTLTTPLADDLLYIVHDPAGTAAGNKITVATLRDYINVKDYGAVGNGTTDDTAAIQAAADAITGTATKLYIPVGTFRIASGIDLSGIQNIEMDGLILADFAGTAITAGGPYLFCANHRIRVQRNGTAQAGDVGIRYTGLYSSQILLEYINNFDTGAQFMSVASPAGSGVGYNTIFAGEMTSCITSCIVLSCNENTLIGGRFGGLDGIVLSDGGISFSPNNNLIIHPCVEACTRYGIRVQAGSGNDFLFVRDEGSRTADFYIDDVSTGTKNIYVSGYNDPPTMTEGVAATSGESFNRAISQYTWLTSFEQIVDVSFIGAYRDGAAAYDLHLPGNVALTNIYTNTRVLSEDNRYVLNRGVVSLGYYPNRAAGVFLDTSTFKNFILEVKDQAITPTNYGNMWVKCYDADNAVLSGTTPSYVQAMASITSDGTGYRRSANFSSTSRIQEILFHSDVKKAFIGVSAGSSNSSGSAGFIIKVADNGKKAIGTILIPSDNVACPVIVTGPRETLGSRISPTAPLQGWFDVGEKVHGTTSEGWVCTSRLDSAVKVEWTAAAVQGDIDATAGMLAADIIGIEMDNGVMHWSTIASVDDGDTLTLDNAVPAGRTLPLDASVYTMRFSTNVNVPTGSAYQINSVSIINQATATTTPAVAVSDVAKSWPVYDSTGTLIGYVPIFVPV